MRLLFMGLVLLCAFSLSAASAQAVYSLEGSAGTLPNGKAFSTWYANAVCIGKGEFLTALHCYTGVGPTPLVVGPRQIKINGYRCSRLLWCNDVMCCLEVPELEGVPVPIAKNSPNDGDKVIQLFSMFGGEKHARVVTWEAGGIVPQGFVKGQSGSGVYNSKGELVGIVQTIVRAEPCYGLYGKSK